MFQNVYFDNSRNYFRNYLHSDIFKQILGVISSAKRQGNLVPRIFHKDPEWEFEQKETENTHIDPIKNFQASLRVRFLGM